MDPILLHVDDAEDDIMLLNAALQRGAIPFRLKQFTSIAPAIAYLRGEGSFNDRELHPLPSAVLLDHHLCGFTGAEALTELRKLPGCSRLPFVILSGSESPEHLRESYEAGADHFILKPSGQGRLELVLKTLYECATARPPCFTAFQALAEYRGLPLADPLAPPPTNRAFNRR